MVCIYKIGMLIHNWYANTKLVCIYKNGMYKQNLLMVCIYKIYCVF